MLESAYYYSNKLVQSIIKDGVEIIPDGPDICPYAWAKPIHELNCDLIWPKEIDEPPYNSVSFDDSLGHDCHQKHHDEMDLEDNDDLLDSGKPSPLINLDTPEYAGRVYGEMIIEKLLAKGGIRLAGVLNYLFADYGEEVNARRRTFLADLKA